MVRDRDGWGRGRGKRGMADLGLPPRPAQGHVPSWVASESAPSYFLGVGPQSPHPEQPRRPPSVGGGGGVLGKERVPPGGAVGTRGLLRGEAQVGCQEAGRCPRPQCRGPEGLTQPGLRRPGPWQPEAPRPSSPGQATLSPAGGAVPARSGHTCAAPAPAGGQVLRGRSTVGHRDAALMTGIMKQ